MFSQSKEAVNQNDNPQKWAENKRKRALIAKSCSAFSGGSANYIAVCVRMRVCELVLYGQGYSTQTRNQKQRSGLRFVPHSRPIYIYIFFFYPADPQVITYREVYQEFQPSCDIFRRSGAKGCLDHRFRAPPAFTAQLLTLH